MSEDTYGATVAKRRLSRRLVALRARAELSVHEATGKLGWRRGRLNRDAALPPTATTTHLEKLAATME